MPKLFVHAPEGVYTAAGRAAVAAALTELGMACERLADRPEVRAGVWVLFCSVDAVFQGGKVGSEPAVALVVYALQGGLDDGGRRRLIAEATSILQEHATSGEGPPCVYVVIQDTPETNWGMAGQQVSLANLRA